MSNGRKWVYSTVVLALLLLAGVLVAGFQIIDQAISLAYLDQSYEDQQQVLELLEDLLPEMYRGRTKEDVVTLIREVRPDALIVETESSVSVSGLRFEFDEQGLLSRVGPHESPPAVP